jgi:hypothetical protein
MRSPALLLCAACAAGCVGDVAPSALDGGDGGAVDLARGDAPRPDLLAPPDLARIAPDLSGADLTGLLDCFGVAVCDPTMQFCIKYYDGSQAAPGNVSAGSPACYEPSDTCANMNQNMDCGCIQNDPILGMYCQGACVDNGDGTFGCFQS